MGYYLQNNVSLVHSTNLKFENSLFVLEPDCLFKNPIFYQVIFKSLLLFPALSVTVVSSFSQGVLPSTNKIHYACSKTVEIWFSVLILTRSNVGETPQTGPTIKLTQPSLWKCVNPGGRNWLGNKQMLRQYSCLDCFLGKGVGELWTEADSVVNI